MKTAFFLIPLAGGITGWIIVACVLATLFKPRQPVKLPFTKTPWQGLIPQKKHQLASDIREIVEVRLLCVVTEEFGIAPEILNRVTDSVVETARERVEQRIPAILPRVVKEKIKGTVEEIIRKEVPRFIDTIIDNIRNQGECGESLCMLLENKIREYDLDKLEASFARSREAFLLKAGGAAIGLVSGLLQLFIIWLMPA